MGCVPVVFEPEKWLKKLEENSVPEPNTGCFLWLGASSCQSVRSRHLIYGTFFTGSKVDGTNRTVFAHRISYMANFGAIPDGMLVCHKCDTPLCVNPKHLFLGTYLDNNQDMQAKGRKASQAGIFHSRRSLDESQVWNILSMHKSGFRPKEIVKHLGVSKHAVSAICRGKSWLNIRSKFDESNAI